MPNWCSSPAARPKQRAKAAVNVNVTSYRCDACGTRWEYENDKTNQQAGWSVVGQ